MYIYIYIYILIYIYIFTYNYILCLFFNVKCFIFTSQNNSQGTFIHLCSRNVAIAKLCNVEKLENKLMTLKLHVQFNET